ncbi:MAG: hypothetical protein IPN01_31780 [Deltaproteobacteria bacterium]|nr:hypothetical protein [Deltaproteobacteria bacterium]
MVARWERAAEVVVSPKGDAVAFVEGHKVYTAPLPLTGGEAIELGPKGGAFPVTARSESAGGLAELDGGLPPLGDGAQAVWRRCADRPRRAAAPGEGLRQRWPT